MAYFSTFSHKCLHRISFLDVSCTTQQHRTMSRSRLAHTKAPNTFGHVEVQTKHSLEMKYRISNP